MIDASEGALFRALLEMSGDLQVPVIRKLYLRDQICRRRSVEPSYAIPAPPPCIRNYLKVKLMVWLKAPVLELITLKPKKFPSTQGTMRPCAMFSLLTPNTTPPS